MSTDNSIQLRPNVKDETGEVYGKLTVLGYAGSKLKSLPGAYWNCLCECGREHIVAGRALRNKTIQSCGCSKNRTDEVGNEYTIAKRLDEQNWTMEQVVKHYTS